MACTIALAPDAYPIRTRGFTACPGDAQEKTTVLDGSSPHVRWICSGVPSAGTLAGCARNDASDDAAARPVAPTSLKKLRRDTETAPCAARSDGPPSGWQSGCSAGAVGLACVPVSAGRLGGVVMICFGGGMFAVCDSV